MSGSEAEVWLKRFGIPIGDGERQTAVRRVLARLLAAGGIELGCLQLVRDVVEISRPVEPEAFLFVTAMILAVRAGNTHLVPTKGVRFLADAGYLAACDEGQLANEDFERQVANLWGKAVAAAEGLEGNPVVVRAGGCWYFAKDYAAVKAVSDDLARRMKLLSGDALEDFDLDRSFGFGYTLESEQVKAAQGVLLRKFTVITGGPGTGKTTIVCAFLRALLEAKKLKREEIALAAPTARAARRMGEALRKECDGARNISEEVKRELKAIDGTTIHSLLGGYRPKWVHHEKNKLSQKLIVVDESSMVDLQLMRALLAATDKSARLVLIGDANQLPSVEEGAVLGDIAGQDGDDGPVRRLATSHRFTGVLKVCADAVNAGDLNALTKNAPELSNDATWVRKFGEGAMENVCYRLTTAPKAKEKNIQKLMVDWAEHFGLFVPLMELASCKDWSTDDSVLKGVQTDLSRNLFKFLDKSRILAVVRKGPYGVEGINRLLVEHRFKGEYKFPVDVFSRPGVPVMVTVNMRSVNLFNGDIGVTVKTARGMVVLFPRGAATVCCPVGELPEHELAYAITVHKSQGSEFENVLVVLPADVRNPLLSRPLVYTGVTRARMRAAILGPQEVLKTSLAREMKRDSGVLKWD